MDNVLYSIGHSSQSFEEFLQMLQSQRINVIVDVRSIPASKYSPQFNKEPLRASLSRHNISYMHFGEEFGARRTDALDEYNNVNFEKAATTSNFQKGVERIKHGLEKGYRIAFMCSEANPLECHRFALVSRYFHEHGTEVMHIMRDKDQNPSSGTYVKSHQELQDIMIAEYVKKKKVPPVSPPDIFGENEVTPVMQVTLAYRQKNKEIAYHQQEQEYIY